MALVHWRVEEKDRHIVIQCALGGRSELLSWDDAILRCRHWPLYNISIANSSKNLQYGLPHVPYILDGWWVGTDELTRRQHFLSAWSLPTVGGSPASAVSTSCDQLATWVPLHTPSWPPLSHGTLFSQQPWTQK